MNAWLASGRFSGMTRTTSGITSPARLTMTVSPTPDVLALYLISVMQCRIRHCYAADPHRTEPRHRRQCAGTAHLHLDIQHFRHSLFRRELAGDGPPGSPGDKAQFSLLSQVIDLEDYTVYFIGQLWAQIRNFSVKTDTFLYSGNPFRFSGHRQAP